MANPSGVIRSLAVLMAGMLASVAVPVAIADNLPEAPGDRLHPAHADEADQLFAIPDVLQASQVNDDTVGIVFSGEELLQPVLRNLDAEITAHDGPRLVPILGKNDVQNVYDLLYLNNVDIAVAHADAIEYVRRIGNFPAATNVIQSVLDIHQDKIVLLAGQDIDSVADLAGKRVFTGPYASGSYVSGVVIMDILGIDVETVSGTLDSGLQQLRDGEVSAVLQLLHTEEHTGDDDHDEAEPTGGLAGFDGGDAVKVLALEDNALEAVYTAATLTTDDLPNLLQGDQSIASYDVHTVLVAYRWRSTNPRYEKTESFVNAVIDTTEHLREGPQKHFWTNLDIQRQSPGITRLALVDQVLQEREARRQAELLAEQERLEAQREAERLERVGKLRDQQEALTALIAERANTADLQELETLVEKLDSFFGNIDAGNADTGQ